MFDAMLPAIWHDLAEVKLADARDGRTSFRRFGGFACSEPTPARLRGRRKLLRHQLDEARSDEITAQLQASCRERLAAAPRGASRDGMLADAAVVGQRRRRVVRPAIAPAAW